MSMVGATPFSGNDRLPSCGLFGPGYSPWTDCAWNLGSDDPLENQQLQRPLVPFPPLQPPSEASFHPTQAHTQPKKQPPHTHSKTSNKSPQSQILKDFISGHCPVLGLQNIKGHVIEFARDQFGSRLIQEMLEAADEEQRELVFQEIISRISLLVHDTYGNHVIQKFFEIGSQVQKKMIANQLQGRVLSLTLNIYGCRVIQKALECCCAALQVQMISELGPENLVQCAMDENGNYVIQKAIMSVDPQLLCYIVHSFQGQVLALATNTYGCRVIQRALERCNREQVNVLIEELHKCTVELVKDTYGNYVIQNILENGQAADRHRVFASLRGQLCSYSQHKCASNVIEKCISCATRQERSSIIEEICAEERLAFGSVLISLIKDQYGNYVVQKCLECAEPAQQKQLIYRIRPYATALKKTRYAKHIADKMHKLSM